MTALRVVEPALRSGRNSMSPRLVFFGVATAIALLAGIAEAQGTFALRWNSCAAGAPNAAPIICGDGSDDVLVAMFTPDIAMPTGLSILAVFEIQTSGSPPPPVPPYFLDCLLSNQFFTDATCPAADRLLAAGNTCRIVGVETPVNGDPSRVRFRVLANRPVASPKPLTAGHAYQAFAIRFPDMDPADAGCEGCDTPFHVFVVEHMALRGYCPPTPTPIFLANGGSPCIAGNQTCDAPVAVDGPSGVGQFRLSCAPNPTGGYVRLSYQLSSSSDVDLFVTDLAGRAVRRLESGTRPRGAHALTWDGRDELGRRVAAGVYWLTLRAEGRRSAVRLVMSR